ncbi:DNA methylase [Leucobacter sp. UCD-THU]|uniref:DNA-methyltransferase n=1 Tax=Leucobacter sp. UCD-THU TaxID=1292023 RepID=UPI00039ED04B|nr:site-specific DNA-methyltransferase [Leucobacter sp. UCD-THU]EYT55804.1 DNA methylase [Leucobacter sp. UCD-THU]
MSTIELVYDEAPVLLYRGDCREVMATLPDASVDAIITDPPYELGFMGKGWDSSGIAYDPEVWAQACRVLKPGGHALVFGGTRTWHRVAVAVEDAGFEIRDSLAWLYGSGFTKSLDVAKAIDKAAGYWRGRAGAVKSDNGAMSGGNYERTPKGDPVTSDAEVWEGWGTALKPAFEPVVVARKPIDGTVVANVLAHGVGALNIDASRIGTGTGTQGARGDESSASGRYGDSGAVSIAATPEPRGESPMGRFPSNVLLDESQAAELDRQSGVSVSRRGKPRSGPSGEGWGMTATGAEYDDLGGASRFFYVAKAGKDERPIVDGHRHATVKPLALMRYLVRMVTPPGGTVLEPFAGSGTTIEAARAEGFNVIAAELDEDGTHIPLILQRLDRPYSIPLFSDDDRMVAP